MPDRFFVIINHGSGGESDDDELQQQVNAAFRAHALTADIHFFSDGDEFKRLLKQACASDCEVIVAGGGDGTISGLAAEIINTDKTLGVLPLGTLNHFAKDLAIPQELDAAVQMLTQGKTITIDVGEVNGRIFINNSSLGLYPHLVRRREKRQKLLGSGKWSAAFRAALQTLRRYPFIHLTLSADGKQQTFRTPFVFVGNNVYELDTFSAGARHCLTDGKLSVYCLRETSRPGLLRIAARTLFGRLRTAKDFLCFNTEELTIETRRKHLLVARDGEVERQDTPLKYRLLPRALRLIVPTDYVENMQPAQQQNAATAE